MGVVVGVAVEGVDTGAVVVMEEVTEAIEVGEATEVGEVTEVGMAGEEDARIISPPEMVIGIARTQGELINSF